MSISDQRAAAASELARQLRDAARMIRHWGGELRYHPLTGERPKAPGAFLDAMTAVESVALAIQQGAPERSLDEAALTNAATADAADAAAVRAGHASLDERTRTVIAAVAVLRTVLGEASREASVDAPYGSGAPRRHHPGALSTIVAARVEDLVLSLESIAILKANFSRRHRAS